MVCPLVYYLLFYYSTLRFGLCIDHNGQVAHLRPCDLKILLRDGAFTYQQVQYSDGLRGNRHHDETMILPTETAPQRPHVDIDDRKETFFNSRCQFSEGRERVLAAGRKTQLASDFNQVERIRAKRGAIGEVSQSRLINGNSQCVQHHA